MEQPKFSAVEVEEVKAEKAEAKEARPRNNVIVGPWPRRSPEQKPANDNEPEARRVALESKREEIDKIYEDQAKEAQAEPAADPEEKVFPFTETYTQYRPCEACGGKGRRWLIMKCSVCQGLGSVPASTSQRTGAYVPRNEFLNFVP